VIKHIQFVAFAISFNHIHTAIESTRHQKYGFDKTEILALRPECQSLQLTQLDNVWLRISIKLFPEVILGM